MAVRERQYTTYIQKPAVETTQPTTSVTIKRTFKVTAKEKFLWLAFITIAACFAIAILYKQSAIHQTTKEIQEIEKEIATVNKENVDLKVQVDELSTYDRIIKKANALGLTLNEKNVKVVPGE